MWKDNCHSLTASSRATKTLRKKSTCFQDQDLTPQASHWTQSACMGSQSGQNICHKALEIKKSIEITDCSNFSDAIIFLKIGCWVWERLHTVNNQSQKEQIREGSTDSDPDTKESTPSLLWRSALPVTSSTGEAIVLPFIRKKKGTKARWSLQEGLCCKSAAVSKSAYSIKTQMGVEVPVTLPGVYPYDPL